MLRVYTFAQSSCHQVLTIEVSYQRYKMYVKTFIAVATLLAICINCGPVHRSRVGCCICGMKSATQKFKNSLPVHLFCVFGIDARVGEVCGSCNVFAHRNSNSNGAPGKEVSIYNNCESIILVYIFSSGNVKIVRGS